MYLSCFSVQSLKNIYEKVYFKLSSMLEDWNFTNSFTAFF